jgi:hypothetical protein
MNWIHVEASDVIEARPEDVYAVIADYRAGHPAIVPKPYFSDWIVEKGGRGAGTIIRANVMVFGRVTPLHSLVSEPEPGRVLVETDIETGQYTTFTIERLNAGNQSRVTIASEFPRPAGFTGFMTALTLPRITRKMYKQELRQLADYVRSKPLA